MKKEGSAGLRDRNSKRFMTHEINEYVMIVDEDGYTAHIFKMSGTELVREVWVYDLLEEIAEDNLADPDMMADMISEFAHEWNVWFTLRI